MVGSKPNLGSFLVYISDFQTILVLFSVFLADSLDSLALSFW